MWNGANEEQQSHALTTQTCMILGLGFKAKDCHRASGSLRPDDIPPRTLCCHQAPTFNVHLSHRQHCPACSPPAHDISTQGFGARSFQATANKIATSGRNLSLGCPSCPSRSATSLPPKLELGGPTSTTPSVPRRRSNPISRRVLESESAVCRCNFSFSYLPQSSSLCGRPARAAAGSPRSRAPPRSSLGQWRLP
jgi:hypothetical protein